MPKCPLNAILGVSLPTNIYNENQTSHHKRGVLECPLLAMSGPVPSAQDTPQASSWVNSQTHGLEGAPRFGTCHKATMVTPSHFPSFPTGKHKGCEGPQPCSRPTGGFPAFISAREQLYIFLVYLKRGGGPTKGDPASPAHTPPPWSAASRGSTRGSVSRFLRLQGRRAQHPPMQQVQDPGDPSFSLLRVLVTVRCAMSGPR